MFNQKLRCESCASQILTYKKSQANDTNAPPNMSIITITSIVEHEMRMNSQSN
ncbi:hypothetical protein LEP1GSC107_1905 [Leptospira interrogans serovar Grippotyphosa str. UI 12769]|uniref:Uncharacterized protein n=1 Tax=Leptospira interrogans serovar Manilae TaxID=214675 RepID=A0AAQ1NZJ0_LEPIR|nr:hypothetical protein LEP1GSC089_2207 [Leptospira interrogans serovar Autumnalis str. LP101]EMN84091.1 hypothetical protein LEP1GSC107_1905 [Leptospira interrogans serovar Grippotyphosa str. UI 12769]SOR62172.1 conserved hypothetical protein [Leptospira interrogans serovar Manilae]